MTGPPERRSLLVALMLITALASVAFAAPWAAHVRQSIRPQLPLFVVVLATITGVAQLVMGVVEGLGKRGGWSAAALPIVLGISAMCMALSFLPSAPGTVPRLLPILGAAFFAVTAAVLQRRTRERSGL
jgi:hypothetical protein